jgi:signal recognition particle subunit SEC65
MKQMKITEDGIAKILKKLKIDKSPGPDKIHPRILIEIADTIAIPLKIIFEQSLKDKEVPKCWKEAQISAIFKKGKKCVAGN